MYNPYMSEHDPTATPLVRVPVPDEKAFSLTLDQYRFLSASHPDELERLAKIAGKKTADEFLSMMERAAEQGKEDFTRRVQMRERLEQDAKEYQLLPDEIRIAVKNWRPTAEELAQAESDEKAGYEAIDKDNDKARKLFRNAVLVQMRALFVELCKNTTLEGAQDAIRYERDKRLRETNVHPLRLAIEDAKVAVDRWVRDQGARLKQLYRNRASDAGPTGPAEKFEIDTFKRSPVSGRSPHRRNDEDGGW